MLQSSNNSSWSDLRCVLSFTQQIRSLNDKSREQIVQKNARVLQEVSQTMLHRIGSIRRKQGKSAEWERWTDAYNAFVRLGEPSGVMVWNKAKQDYVLEHSVEHAVTQQTQVASQQVPSVVLPGWPQTKVWQDVAGANKRVADLQGLLDLMVQRVQAGADLTPFIELIVKEGKTNKRDPHYVSDDVMNTAFLLYAYSIPANRADKLLTYTDSKYAARVRFAAASAAAQFAKAHINSLGKTIENDPSGRLMLNNAQRAQILAVFQPIYQSSRTTLLTKGVLAYYLERVYENAYGYLEKSSGKNSGSLATFAPAIALSPTLAEMLAAEASAYAASMGVSVAEGMAALQTIAASGSAAMAGEVMIVGVPLVIFGVALDDAFAPTYRAAFERKLREALHVTKESIGTVTVETDIEHDDEVIYGLIPHVATGAQTQTQTQTQTQRNVCVYLGSGADMVPDPSRTDSSSGMLSNSALKNPKFILLGDERTYEHWNAQMPGLGGLTRGECIRKKLLPECINERDQLQRLYNKRNSFVGGSTSASGTSIPNRKLYARAVWRAIRFGGAGKWVLNLENADGREIQNGQLPQNINRTVDQVLRDLFDNETAEIIGGALHGHPGNFEEILLRGYGYMKFRDGAHDRNNPTVNHFHMEQKCIYNPNGGQQVCTFGKPPTFGNEYYICNLAIYHNAVGQYNLPRYSNEFYENYYN